jgi:hypothetical protein
MAKSIATSGVVKGSPIVNELAGAAVPRDAIGGKGGNVYAQRDNAVSNAIITASRRNADFLFINSSAKATGHQFSETEWD